MFRNRIGFLVLGLANNFAYVIMLSAAYDLLSSSMHNSKNHEEPRPTIEHEACNEHSTATILLADSLPSLLMKLVYPFTLVGIPLKFKVLSTACLSSLSFILTGLSQKQFLIFLGVISASLSSGLGEASFVSNTPLYGDVSLSGWSMGTGLAGLLGAGAYLVLKYFLSTTIIMLTMNLFPLAMIISYFYVIVPINSEADDITTGIDVSDCGQQELTSTGTDVSMEGDASLDSQARQELSTHRTQNLIRARQELDNRHNRIDNNEEPTKLDLGTKLRLLPSLAKYFGPLWLVYFAEYFINQGLFELIYYPEQKDVFDKAAQYRAFQVSYQLGVFLSRSSLELFRIKHLWTMGLLQGLNAVMLLSHVLRFIHIPSFYLIIVLIIYEGLLGGFGYVNTFYRVKKDITAKELREFCLSSVTLAESTGVVMAGLVALPVHDAICRRY